MQKGKNVYCREWSRCKWEIEILVGKRKEEWNKEKEAKETELRFEEQNTSARGGIKYLHFCKLLHYDKTVSN